jgi:transposase
MRGLTLTQQEQARLQTLNLVLEGRIVVEEAAHILGLSERHTWRVLASYRKDGVMAMAHGNRGRQPLNTTSEEIRQRVITLASTRYAGFNHTHLTELLVEREGITLARSTVRRLLVEVGIPSPRHRRPPRHRCRRERMPQEGMLVQIDGSHHRWLEERGPWLTLMLAIDDATGKVPHALFRDQENTEGYFHLMAGIIRQCGIPLAIYSDRHTVFRRARLAGEKLDTSIAGERKPTQFGRAMRELGVTQVFAHSPEAKGRVERANGTFQDRLVSELRLAGASTIGEATSILEAFVPRFNKAFGVPPAEPESAYRQLDPGQDIEGVLCNKEQRRVAKDNTVRYYSHTLQLFPETERKSYARARVEVEERLDGRLLVSYQGKILTPSEAPPLAVSLRTRTNSMAENESSVLPITQSSEPEELEEAVRIREPHSRMMWYEDSAMKHLHRELIKAGMARAREHGKRIGRPRVTERPEFLVQFGDVIARIESGGLSRRKAAKELSIGYATLKRLLDARNQLSFPTPVAAYCSDGKSYAQVLY